MLLFQRSGMVFLKNLENRGLLSVICRKTMGKCVQYTTRKGYIFPTAPQKFKSTEPEHVSHAHCHIFVNFLNWYLFVDDSLKHPFGLGLFPVGLPQLGLVQMTPSPSVQMSLVQMG